MRIVGYVSLRDFSSSSSASQTTLDFEPCAPLPTSSRPRYEDRPPSLEIDEEDVSIGHEATVSKVGEEQLFYLMSRGLTEAEATAMVVNGFIEPIVKTLPMDYAIEMNRLITLQMQGAIG